MLITGDMHTPPDGIVVSSFPASPCGVTSSMNFQMLEYYPTETPIELEIYAFYGGKTGKTTINL